MKISVLTASVRPEGLDIVRKCLDKQDFDPKDFEWIIVGNTEVCEKMGHQYSSHQITRVVQEEPYRIVVVKERDKKEGDFYNVDKAYNDLYKNATGELGVMWTDLTWAPNDVLSLFWQHSQNNPKACVGGIGHQYELVEMGKPQVEIWHDPRQIPEGGFGKVHPVEFEMCLASLPITAVKEAGGWDEEFDKFAAMGEKELCLRMEKLGYEFYIDSSIEYRAVKHPRLGGQEEWDKRYFAGTEYFQKCIHDILEGTRLKLNYLSP